MEYRACARSTGQCAPTLFPNSSLVNPILRGMLSVPKRCFQHGLSPTPAVTKSMIYQHGSERVFGTPGLLPVCAPLAIGGKHRWSRPRARRAGQQGFPCKPPKRMEKISSSSCVEGLALCANCASFSSEALWLQVIVDPPGKNRGLAMTVIRLSQHSSIPLDDKNGLIVNTIFLANLSQTIISF